MNLQDLKGEYMDRTEKLEYLQYVWSDLGEVSCHLKDAGRDDLAKEAEYLRQKIYNSMDGGVF